MMAADAAAGPPDPLRRALGDRGVFEISRRDAGGFFARVLAGPGESGFVIDPVERPDRLAARPWREILRAQSEHPPHGIDCSPQECAAGFFVSGCRSGAAPMGLSGNH